MTIPIGTRRELFVDGYLLNGKRTTAKEVLHHPIRRELVMTNDAPWEANGWVYYTVFEDEEIFRMYYLSMPMYNKERTKHDPPFHHINYAQSEDGIHWTKPTLNLFEFEGSSENNIVMVTDTMDAFHVFIDKNPACPKNERYKAVYTKPGCQLWCMTSGDGIHFIDGWLISDKGYFDSHNTAFWDEKTQCYLCYSRDFHDGENGERIRDIRRMESKDFKAWSEPEMVKYEDSPHDFHMYTNGIQPYFRAPELYIAFPARYIERKEWTGNYNNLCGSDHRKWRTTFHPRYGLALTDGLFMSSRDGKYFRRWNEAFLRPGPESENRWVYGDGYASYGLLATNPPVGGEDKELSFYVSANNWTDNPVQVFRHTIRMDGFVSRRAAFEGAMVVTKPITFNGDVLLLNFSTSSAGFVRVWLEDEEETPIDGYDSGQLFGDRVDRQVDFEKPLCLLAGKPVVLCMELSDADVYAFQFSSEVK